MSECSRTARAVLILTASLTLTAAPALADAPVGHSGVSGAHSLTDSPESPGARCFYNDDSNVYRIRVMPPSMFARDRTRNRDRQWVGSRVELRYRAPGGPWQTLHTTPVTTVRAWDDTPAALPRITVPVAHPVGSGEYRVNVRMTWYRPGTSTVWEGTARHAVEYYTYPLAGPGSADGCPAGIL